MITLTFSCGGCDAVEQGTSWLKREFVSITGRSYGFGSFQAANTLQDVAPEGWVAFDPYTSCTYCPKCWAEIESGIKSGADQNERQDNENSGDLSNQW